MEIRSLGPLLTTESGTPVTPTAVKPRKVLALLAMNPDHTVPLRAIAEELWEDSPPRSALTTVQTYVLQIRNLIRQALLADPAATDPDPKRILSTQYDGYVLRTHGGYSDLAEFGRLADIGRRALDEGYPHTAAIRLRAALRLWRGPALVDIRTGPLLGLHTRRMQESRMAALHARITADFRLGRHLELTGELTALTTQYPMDEPLHAQLMCALHHCGRRTDALRVFAGLQATLRRELGSDACPQLQRLRQALLDGSPELDIHVPHP